MRKVYYILIALICANILNVQSQVSPDTGSVYNIKNYSGNYLTFLSENNGWNMFSIDALKPVDFLQKFTLNKPLGESVDTFNILNYQGKYFTLHPSNNWDCIVGEDSSLVKAQFRIIPVDVEGVIWYRLQNLNFDPTANAFLGVDNTDPGTFTYMDKSGDNSLWQFEIASQGDEELEIVGFVPDTGATNVGNLVEISVAFNKIISITDTSKVSIVDAQGTTVEGLKLMVNGAVLKVLHDPLEFGKTYTVSLLNGAITGLNTDTSWTFQTGIPVMPQAPKTYNIINVNTGYYLTLPEIAPAGDSRFSTITKIEGEGSEIQAFRFLNPTEDSLTFSIQVNSGGYMAKESGSNWAMVLSEDDSIAGAQFKIVPDGVNFKIQSLEHNGTNLFLGPNNTSDGAPCYVDKTADVTWTVVEVDVPLGVFKTEPKHGSENAPLNVDVIVEFNKEFSALDLSLVKITNSIGVEVADVMATIVGTKLYIQHADFDFFEVYTVNIPVGSIQDLNADVTWSFTTKLAPTANSLTPVNDTTDVNIDALILVGFTEDILPDSIDKIMIFDADNNALDGVSASVNRATLSINHELFDYESMYTVVVPKEAIKGVVDSTIWSFTTTTAPEMTSTNPTDGIVDVALNPVIRVAFNKKIYAESLEGITILDTDGNDVADVPSISGFSLYISITALNANTKYSVKVPAGAIRGIENDIDFSFTTKIGVGVDDVQSQTGIKVYPTFSNGIINIVNAQKSKVSIINMMGKMVKEYQINDQKQIDLSSVRNGQYIVVIETGDLVSTFKITKR